MNKTYCNQKRLVAIFACVFFLYVMAASFFFIAEEYDHTCIGEDCSICHNLTVCKNILQTVIGSLQTEDAAALILAIIVIAYFHFVFVCCPITLVSLKVKLSD